MRERVILICENCLSRNYKTTRKKFDVSEKMSVNKFCPKCNKYTVHKESK